SFASRASLRVPLIDVGSRTGGRVGDAPAPERRRPMRSAPTKGRQSLGMYRKTPWSQPMRRDTNHLADERPNILLIMSDEHDPAVTGCYGHPHVQTPNLDRLAEEGVTFDS